MFAVGSELGKSAAMRVIDARLARRQMADLLQLVKRLERKRNYYHAMSEVARRQVEMWCKDRRNDGSGSTGGSGGGGNGCD